MGKLYGIGVGPGDPELLTLKAHRLLNEADVLFCPQKEDGADSFAFDIIKGLLKNAETEIVNLVYPMNYHGERLRELWEKNACEIAGRLEGDKIGVFITLGDPAVYSTFMYTLPYIEAHGIPVEVVPGIPSFCGVADSVKWPLVAWNEKLLIAPVRKNSSEDLGKLLKEHENVVLMKPSANKEALIQAMEENHLEEHFVLVAKYGTGEEQRITDFEELKTFDIPYLSTMIIKKQGR